MANGSMNGNGNGNMWAWRALGLFAALAIPFLAWYGGQASLAAEVAAHIRADSMATAEMKLDIEKLEDTHQHDIELIGNKMDRLLEATISVQVELAALKAKMPDG